MIEIFLTLIICGGFFSYIHRDKIYKAHKMLISGYKSYRTLSDLTGGLDMDMMMKIMDTINSEKNSGKNTEGTGGTGGTGKDNEIGK